MMYKLTLMTMLKKYSTKKMVKNSIHVLLQEIVIPLPVSIFFNKMLHLYFQIGKFFLNLSEKFSNIIDQILFHIVTWNCLEKCLKLTFLVISQTIIGLIYWIKRFSKNVCKWKRITLLKDSNSLCSDCPFSSSFQFFYAVLKTTNFDLSENA